MAEVRLEGVSKTYPGGVQAVRDLSFEVRAGELVVLAGPSGCGKTTTLRLIAGLEEVSGGRIGIGGREVTREPPHRRGVALVTQRAVLYPHLNVAQNLALGLKGTAREAMAEVVRLLELEEVLQRRPAELSGGQQQRVALGRALAARPGVLLLDEPLAHLDGPLRWEIRRELHLLQRRLDATMLYVTHDQEEALGLADRIVVLDRGRLQQHEMPQGVLDRPASIVVGQAFGWPPMNRLEAVLRDRAGRLVLTGPEVELEVPRACAAWGGFLGRAVVVGLRPEGVRIADGEMEREAEGRLDMELLLVERLGAGWLATLQRGGLRLAARLGSTASARPLSALPVNVAVALDLSAAHLFDRQTGRALVHGRPACPG
jgi:ABC-type sugar transport system ATPase subunit